ncbi:MAG: hypothetical protein HQK50_10380 [Oligoflexia bacterium]|nr:hypothetical protein [Oligoflexia bacterium]MBF0365968.1 hypothetical protein [Oligoflexia bacterium]
MGRIRIKVVPPSFPEVPFNKILPKLKEKQEWQVICGDAHHYRVGLYSPKFTSLAEVERFEKHTCDEFFMLIAGKVSLVLVQKGHIKVVPLKLFQPMMVSDWHNGFSPKGSYTGKVLVVERDRFTTLYKSKFDLIT